MATRLHTVELLLDGTDADPEIAAAVATFGYTVQKRAEGRALLVTAKAAVAAGPQTRSAQLRATAAQAADLAALKRCVTDLSAVARAIFADDRPALVALGLDQGRRPEGLARFLVVAETLYNGALNGTAEMKQELADTGYPKTRLEAERAKIDVVRAADTAQGGAKSDAQSATPDRNEALKALEAWAARYKKIARVALRDTPQKLEALGIKA